MHVDIYTFEGDFRFSFKEEENQRQLGLIDLMPSPKFKLLSFAESSGVLDFELGREGSALSNSKGVLKVGSEMRATASGSSLGIQVISGQKKIRVPVLRTAPGKLQFVLPRNYYDVRSDNVLARVGL